MLQATSPLRKKTDIENAVDCFIKQKADKLILNITVKDSPWIIKNKFDKGSKISAIDASLKLGLAVVKE